MLIKSEYSKTPNVTPLYKKVSQNNYTTYITVSILSNLSQVYEKQMFDEMPECLDNVLSKHQCSKKIKKGNGKGDSFGVLLKDI